MSMRVLFNGVVLVRPGGATKIDASAFTNASLAGVGTLGMIGEADEGEPNAIHVFSNPAAMRDTFRVGPLADMAGLAFRASGDPRISAGANTVVAVKANQSTQATATLKGAGVAYATVTGTALAPINLLAQNVTTAALQIEVNGSAAGAGAVFTGNAAEYTGASKTPSGASGDISIRLNGSSSRTQVISFTGEATLDAYAATINANLDGGSARVVGDTLKIASDLKGSLSKVEITAVDAAVEADCGLSVSSTNSVGSTVENIAAIKFSEIKSLVETAYPGPAPAGVTVTGADGSYVTITTKKAEDSSLKFSSTAMATAMGFTAATLYSAGSPVDVLKLTSKRYGLPANLISYLVSDSGGGKMIELSQLRGTTLVKENNSAPIGATAKFSITFTGSCSTAVVSVNATGLTTTLTGATGDDLNLLFAQYDTIQALVNEINAHDGYTAVAITPNAQVELGADLDYVVNSNIKAVTVSLYSKLTDVVSWINNNSSLVTAERVANGPTAPTAMLKAAYLGAAGGITRASRGVSTNTDWTNAFTILGSVRVNQVVPLISYNLSLDGLGSSATVDSVNALADAHAAYYSSTAGKNERHAFLSKRGVKTDIKTAAQLLNSFNSCLCGVQKPTVLGEDGSLKKYPEYAQAVVAASMRCGAELGEPLTYKYVKYYDLETDASWNPNLDAAEMILAGVMFVEPVPGQGFRWVKGVTTYTRTDNDAYTEESVVQGWKNVAYELRTHLENIFTGTRAMPASIAGIKNQAANKLDALKRSGQIVDSVLPDGTRLNAYRDLAVLPVPGQPDAFTVKVTFSPVSGINFTLNDLTLVPAVLAA